MITRRSALRTLALTTGAFALTSVPLCSQNAPAAPEAEGVFKLPPLGYDYDALEPFIDAETMKLHHDKHHAAYVSKLNQAVSTIPGLETKTIEEILSSLDSLPETIRVEVRNQGGGHANHALLWQTLKKNEGAAATGELAAAIDATFQTFALFQEQFSAAAGTVFGSGWTWLALREGKLTIETSPDQDTPLMTGGFPLLGVDVWEHAYYLKYQNRRAEYLAAFQNVINWEYVGSRYAKAMVKPPAAENPA
jgi:Fe-Mn family superoxide dismutase